MSALSGIWDSALGAHPQDFLTYIVVLTAYFEPFLSVARTGATDNN